jgi:hypothetical protein
LTRPLSNLRFHLNIIDRAFLRTDSTTLAVIHISVIDLLILTEDASFGAKFLAKPTICATDMQEFRVKYPPPPGFIQTGGTRGSDSS